MFVHKAVLRRGIQLELPISQPKCHCKPAWSVVLALECVKLQQRFT